MMNTTNPTNATKTTYAFPPGPEGNAAIANVMTRLRGGKLDRLALLSSMTKFGDVSSFHLTPWLRVYLVNHPDYIKYMLVDAPQKFQKGPALKQNARQALGNGLLLSEGDFHKRQRKLAQPAFHHGRIMGYGQVMVDYTLRMMDGWHTDQEFDMHHEMMSLTMQIVAKTLFDADVSEDADEIGQAITEGIRAINQRIVAPVKIPQWLPTPNNRRGNKAGEVLDDTIMGFIEARRVSNEDKGDLLSMLMLAVDDEDGSHMTDQQVADEARTLFAAGHETTANAMAWTWMLLAQHPEVRAKLNNELDSALDGHSPTIQDLSRLPYTEKIIKESMRLYPPAWIMNRQCLEDVTFGDFTIPKDSIILFSQYLMQRDERYFENPDQFIPERWTPEFEKALPKYAYFPFGGGPRVCIGQQFAMMEARLILAAIAQRWDMTLTPGQDIELEPLITLRAKNGIKVRLIARQ